MVSLPDAFAAGMSEEGWVALRQDPHEALSHFDLMELYTSREAAVKEGPLYGEGSDSADWPKGRPFWVARVWRSTKPFSHEDGSVGLILSVTDITEMTR